MIKISDGRFANDEKFPYFAHNPYSRWAAINCGNVYLHRNELGNVTGEELQQIAENPQHHLADRIMYFGSALRTTRSYWRQRSFELLSMVKQLGTPTIFCPICC